MAKNYFLNFLITFHGSGLKSLSEPKIEPRYNELFLASVDKAKQQQIEPNIEKWEDLFRYMAAYSVDFFMLVII